MEVGDPDFHVAGGLRVSNWEGHIVESSPEMLSAVCFYVDQLDSENAAGILHKGCPVQFEGSILSPTGF